MKTLRYCDCGNLIQAEPVEESIELTTKTCSNCFTKTTLELVERLQNKTNDGGSDGG